MNPFKIVKRYWNSYSNPYQKFAYSTRKEKIAYHNLILQTKSQILVLFSPLLVMIFSTFVEADFQPYSSNIQDMLVDRISSIFLWARIISILLLIMFFTINFVNIQTNGKLGYWLALGVERRRFFMYTVGHLAFYSAIGVLQALVFISLLTANQILIGQLAYLFALMFVTNLFIIMLSIFIFELLQNSELSFFVMVFIYSIITIFVAEDNMIRTILLPEFYFNQASSIFGFIQLLFVLVLLLLNNKMFNSKNIELGG